MREKLLFFADVLLVQDAAEEEDMLCVWPFLLRDFWNMITQVSEIGVEKQAGL